jgi:diacylglycerol O-acyltransferase
VVAGAAASDHGAMPRARLSSLDGSFLRVETPAAHMHVAWKGRFAPPGGGTPPGIRALRAQVAGRLRHAERFRQRLAPTPAGLGEPVWVDDERFRVEDHVVELAPAGETLSPARFDALCDRELSMPLDRSRALWRISYARRLDDGGAGLVMKLHHAMVDGMSAMALALLLLDTSPHAGPATTEDDDWAPARAPGASRLALEALADRGSESLRAAGAMARLARSPGRGVRIADTLRRTALAVGEDVLRSAPSSHLNAAIGPERTLVHHSEPIAPLLEARRRHGVTLNDVVLGAVAGGLRALALDHGRRPEPLKVMVPVDMRSGSGAEGTGNRIAFVFVDLPVDLHRPAARLMAVHAQTQRFKRTGRAAGGQAILGALGALPEPLKGPAARLAAGPRMYNLTVSNVPGPRVPVYLLGCELREAVPVIPLSEGHALSIGVFTYRDRITFGGYADPVALPEVPTLPQALNAALLELAGTSPRRRASLAVA